MIKHCIRKLYKGRDEREGLTRAKDIPMASVSCSPPSSSSESETLFFAMDLSSSSSSPSSDPLLEDKFALSLRVVELGIEKGVTTKEEPSLWLERR